MTHPSPPPTPRRHRRPGFVAVGAVAALLFVAVLGPEPSQARLINSPTLSGAIAAAGVGTGASGHRLAADIHPHAGGSGAEPAEVAPLAPLAEARRPRLVAQVLAPLRVTATAGSAQDAAFALFAGTPHSSGEDVVAQNSSGGGSPLEKVLRTAAGHSNQTQADIAQVRLNDYGDGKALIGSLVFSGIGTLVLALAFTALRRWNPAVYAREGFAPGGGTADRGWLRMVLSTSPDEEVRTAGLDAWSLLEFYRLHLQILSALAPPVVLVLCPAHYFATKGDLLSRLDIGGLPDRSTLFWVHAAFVWLVVVIVSYCVMNAHGGFLTRRFLWLRSIPSPQATTVLVENLPEALRSDGALRDYFSGRDGLFVRQSQIVQSAYVIRKTQALRPKWEQLQEQCKALSLVKSRLGDGARRPHDEAEEAALAEAVGLKRQEVAAERAKVESLAERRDPSVFAANGFVTFSSVFWQRIALKEDFRADKTEFVVSMPPDPDDVVYDNLVADTVDSKTWEWIGRACLVAVFVFWSPVVVFISSWTTLSSVEEYVPLASQVLKAASRIFPFLPPLVEGVLATAALRLFLAFLPAILFKVITSCYAIKSGAVVQVRLCRWYYSFLMIFVLLVTTLGRSLVVTTVALAQDPTGIIDLLAAWLPRTSHYYFNFMIMGWLTLAWEMARAVNLVRYWSLSVIYGCEPKEAKRFSEPEDVSSYGLGARMGLASLMSAITLVFCTCSPLMLVFAIVYFGLGRLAYGYLLVHAESRKPDLGGRFWVDAVQRIFFTLGLFVVLMTGVLIAHFGTFWNGPAAASAAAMVAVYFFWTRTNAYEWETLPLEEMMKAWTSGDGLRSASSPGSGPAAAEAGAGDGAYPVLGGVAVATCSAPMSGKALRYRQPECDPDTDQL